MAAGLLALLLAGALANSADAGPSRDYPRYDYDYGHRYREDPYPYYRRYDGYAEYGYGGYGPYTGGYAPYGGYDYGDDGGYYGRGAGYYGYGPGRGYDGYVDDDW